MITSKKDIKPIILIMGGVVVLLLMGLMLYDMFEVSPLKDGLASLVFVMFLFILNPRLQLLFYVACSPLMVFLETGQEPFQWIAVVRMTMFLILVMRAVALKRFIRLIFENKLIKIGSIYLIYTFILGLIYSESISAGMLMFLRNSSNVLLIPLVYVYYDLRSMKKELIPVIIGPAMVALLLGIYITLSDIFGGDRFYGLGGTYRASSIFPSVNSFAVYIVATVLFIITFLGGSRVSSRKKVIGIVLILAFSVPLILVTFSRRAIAAFLCGVILIFYMIKGASKKFSILLSVVIVLLLVLFLLPQSILLNPRIQELNHPFDNPRVKAWERLRKRVFTNNLTLFLGLKPGSSCHFIIKMGFIRNPEPIIDSYYGTLLANYGLIGLMLFVVFIFMCLKCMWKRYQRSLPSELPLLSSCIVSIITMILASLFGNVIISYPNSFYFWILIGMGITLSEHYDQSNNKDKYEQ